MPAPGPARAGAARARPARRPLAVLQQKEAVAEGRAIMERPWPSSHARFKPSSEPISSTWKPAAAARKNRSARPSASSPPTSRWVAVFQPRRNACDERHHHAIRPRQAGILVAECQRGFVAVMPVGDQQFLVRHQLPNARGVGHPPHAMDRAILVRDVGNRRQRRRLIQQRVDRAIGVGIQLKSCPQCACVWRSSSSRSFFGPESVCSWRCTTPAE